MEEIHDGRHRFHELHRAVEGISYKVLTRTLREPEYHALVSRYDHHTANPRVDNRLTEAGTALVETIHELCGWSRTHLNDCSPHRSTAPATDPGLDLTRDRPGRRSRPYVLPPRRAEPTGGPRAKGRGR
ncbi:hypothetical protein GCM10027089_40110 [Nocardia thraciensis]